MRTMRSTLKIEYNGVEATDIIANDSDSFTWKDNAGGEADTLTINLSNIGQKWMNGFFPSDRDVLKAWIRLEEWAADYRQGELFCGTFKVDSLRFTGKPEKLQLSAISVPINVDFNVRQKNRTWESTTLRSILKDIAGNAGIQFVYDAQDFSIKSTNQNKKTDLAFAYSLCSDYGLAVKLYNDKLVVYDKVIYEKKASSYTIDYKEVQGQGTYTIASDVAGLYDSIKVQYTDSNGKTMTYEYTIPGKTGCRQMFLSTKAESYGDAERKGKAALRENLRQAKTVTLKLMGSAKYIASQCFDLTGFGKLDGKYFIDSVTHDKSGGKYVCTLVAHPAVTEF